MQVPQRKLAHSSFFHKAHNSHPHVLVLYKAKQHHKHLVARARRARAQSFTSSAAVQILNAAVDSAWSNMSLHTFWLWSSC